MIPLSRGLQVMLKNCPVSSATTSLPSLASDSIWRCLHIKVCVGVVWGALCFAEELIPLTNLAFQLVLLEVLTRYYEKGLTTRNKTLSL